MNIKDTFRPDFRCPQCGVKHWTTYEGDGFRLFKADDGIAPAPTLALFIDETRLKDTQK